MMMQMAIFAVNRNEKFRPHERMHQFQLLLARMTGSVNLRERFVNHVRADSEQLIDHTRNRLFIAGNRRGGNNDHVAFTDFELAVLGESHSRKTRHRLALTAGGHDSNFIVRIAVKIVRRDQLSLRNIQISQLAWQPLQR